MPGGQARECGAASIQFRRQRPSPMRGAGHPWEVPEPGPEAFAGLLETDRLGGRFEFALGYELLRDGTCKALQKGDDRFDLVVG